MSSTISKQQLNSLRNEFREYLRTKHSDWDESTVSTRMSDAFFGFNNSIGVDFWSSLTSEEALLIARDRIRDHFALDKQYDNPEVRADYCLSSMRLLKEFLDSNHPALAQDWSGKTVGSDYLRSDFRTWMQTQKKANGEKYSPNTITTYIYALKNGTEKLKLGLSIHSDIFYYDTLEDYEMAYSIITQAPDFEKVDEAAGNKAYSSALVLYKLFLADRGQPNAWIFQGNPKYYDVVRAVNENTKITWAVNQSPKQIKKGDKVYIWVSGTDGGIIAVGTILCDPEMRDPNANDAYNRGDLLKTEPYLAVDVLFSRKLEQTISRSVLLADERTKKLEILCYPGATNFKVTKAQESVIESLIEGTYQRVEASEELTLDDTSKKRYWLYAPGQNASQWDEFLASGIMGIGWDELGDLTQYTTKEEIKSALRSVWEQDKSYINDGHALWQFANEMKPGDIVYAKRGMRTLIGRGIVESEYQYIQTRNEYKHTRKVNWAQTGVWEHPGQAAMKTLTDITPYTDYVQQLELLFAQEGNSVIDDDPEINYSEYTPEDFLSEVFLSPQRYKMLTSLLYRKKNIIIQGAPGVGKTFVAQRLAFSIMGVKDVSRIKIMQFHQSYSYEDFVMGYRPDGNGFKLAKGPFYEFCKRAEEDNERPYFFIIDEINRGNLSKIFGELLMLIESDKRDEKNAIRLLYADEQFYVPSNVYIIGMMNTADRSLAMIDYALRRRFAFFDMEPAFSTDGFRSRQMQIQNPRFDALIAVVETLNKEITQDASLGAGFRIGHSYFCTTEVIDNDWLFAVVEFELLPLLQEYWFDEPSKVESWALRLRSAIGG